ncbi:MAG: SMI1/KNR4 family protein [Leptolyngbyaceae bacterium]|nr:SMI1/KNR4 family protein [Leptolyngbyaceae bacterium]
MLNCPEFENLHRIPCTAQDIIHLEQQIGSPLPKAYKELFLEPMGRGSDGFLKGEDCFYPHLFKIQAWAKELLEENNFPAPLPDDAFVFFMHQGYQFSFFRLTEGDHPPTYSFVEGQKELTFIKSHERFAEFLLTEWNLYKQAMSSLVAC